jgi:hypothetical protein
MYYEVDKDALALLRTARGHHDWLEPEEPFSEVTRVAARRRARGSGARDAPLR